MACTIFFKDFQRRISQTKKAEAIILVWETLSLLIYISIKYYTDILKIAYGRRDKRADKNRFHFSKRCIPDEMPLYIPFHLGLVC